MNFGSLFASLCVVTISLVACTHHPRENPAVVTDSQDDGLGSGEYVVVHFPPGKETLAESEKEKIRVLKSSVEGRGNVSEIKVLAWSDQEYPVNGSKPSMSERQLAEQRGREIKNYLKDDLNSKKDVDVHNMAQKPGVFAEVFKSDDYRLKDSLRAASEAASEMGIVSENKGSKALVLIKYE